MRLEPRIRNPKRKKPTKEIERVWYEYHASFSSGFVEDVLVHLNLAPASTVLDPWNGTGISTQVTQRKGYRAIGVDLNPAMVLVARARQLDLALVGDVQALTADIACRTEASRVPTSSHSVDPLLNWLVPASVAVFRDLEHTVLTMLEASNLYESRSALDDLDSISDVTAFFYVALFRTLRRNLIPFGTSNPTWIKAHAPSADKLHLEYDHVLHSFEQEVSKVVSALQAFVPKSSNTDTFGARIEQGSSESLPIAASSIDAIISSPPYCTRIDYVIATLPELRFLRYTDEDLKRLRNQMLGTPTMNLDKGAKLSPKQIQAWGRTAANFIETVSEHSSKASSTYYLRYFLQYFSSVELSLKEISRVLRPNASCVLVVQDSHYKEVRLDLAKVYLEMAENLTLEAQDRLDYQNGNTLAQINPGARRYRKSTGAIESILILRSRV